MGHVNITNDRDHQVFVFIRDQLDDTAAFVRDNSVEQGLIRFGDKFETDGAKLTVRLRQYWPPHDAPQGKLVGTVDVYANDLVLEAPQLLEVEFDPSIKATVGPHEARLEFKLGSDSVPGRPTTHEDLLNIYNTRVREHGSGFLLAGELDEAAQVLVNEQPALDSVAGTFALRLPTTGYIELAWSKCEIHRFGCAVVCYTVDGKFPPGQAIEAAFIELLAGAVPSGAS
jgi:hypothetical protein